MVSRIIVSIFQQIYSYCFTNFSFVTLSNFSQFENIINIQIFVISIRTETSFLWKIICCASEKSTHFTIKIRNSNLIHNSWYDEPPSSGSVHIFLVVVSTGEYMALYFFSKKKTLKLHFQGYLCEHKIALLRFKILL